MTNLSFDIYLRATPQEIRTVLTEPALLPSWLAGLRLQPERADDPQRLTCEWLQTEHLEINGGASSVVRFDLTAMGHVTRLAVSHRGLEPDGSLLKVITPGWPMILSSLKSLMETGEPLAFKIDLPATCRWHHQHAVTGPMAPSARCLAPARRRPAGPGGLACGRMGRMAIIHHTSLVPTKLELLTSWLPGRTWYAGGTSAPSLTKAGGFRLDDPDGEVGLEFMAAVDDSGDEPVTYHLPLSYRGAPLPGGDGALIGTADHGVLGRRWIYDGTRDPVMVTQMFALLLGEAEPQAQSISGTVDPSVTRSITGNTGELPLEIASVRDEPHSTDITVQPAAAPMPLMLRVNRVLRANSPGLMTGTLGHVTAEWADPRAARSRGRFFVLRVP